MYEAFYGLRERPFDLVPDPRFLFLAARHREALSNLQYGLSTPRGLTVLIGEAGTGKTTLVQAALAGLKDASTRCVLVTNPALTRNEFYEYLASSFKLSAAAATSKARFLFEFRRDLLEQASRHVLSALIVDEAQSGPYDLLEEIRLLSNFETPTAKLLNVVLAGQPELADRLNESSLRQLKQRISLRCELKPMDLSDMASYIAGRIRIAGGRPERIFTQEAVAMVFAASGGIPRTVNVVCDNAMIGGFAEQQAPIPARILREVCHDLDLSLPESALESVRRTLDASGPRPVEKTTEDPVEPQPARITQPVVVGAQAAGSMFGAVHRKRKFSFF